MEIDKLIVALSSIGLSGFIYWYFLAHQEKTVTIDAASVDITVDGGYSPQTIKLKQGQHVTLNFIRKDPSDCLSEVVLPDFGKKAYLPLHNATPIEIETQKVGVFEYACGMNMYHGKIIVE